MSPTVCALIWLVFIVLIVCAVWYPMWRDHIRRKPIPIAERRHINLNDGVWVKLTLAGRTAMENSEAIYWGRDEGPYTYFQLWCLMAALGPLLTMTSKNFIEGNVIHLSRPKDAIRNS
jgi:hypothetical protein